MPRKIRPSDLAVSRAEVSENFPTEGYGKKITRASISENYMK